jgi:hypothetical protein
MFQYSNIPSFLEQAKVEQTLASAMAVKAFTLWIQK